MEFTSIEEIKEYFGIEIEDNKELSKELKRLLKEVHSDTSNGNYKSGKQKREHEELTDALNFVSNSSTEIVITNKEWTGLQKQINELTKFKEEGNLIKTQEINRDLNKSIESSGVKFQKKHNSLKISSIVLTSTISALWIFPSIAEKHPILNQIVNSYRTLFTGIWLGVTAITAILWVFTKHIEKKDLLIKQKYILDSEQNQIFKLFLAWLRVAYRDLVDYSNDKHKYTFTRDDMFNFILNYYSKLSTEFENILNYGTWDLYYEISQNYKSKDILKIAEEKVNLFQRMYQLIFKKPGEIDTDLAQRLTDAMMQKLIERDVIKKGKKKAFNDTFEYEE